MNFLHSYRSELFKTKRTSSWYVGILAAGFVPFIIFTDFMFEEDIHRKVSDHPWENYLREGFMWFNLLSLPLFVLMSATLMAQVEYRNNTWKQVLASPQPLFQVYISRYAALLSMIMAFLATHIVLLIITGLMIGVLFPKYHFMDTPFDFAQLARSTSNTMVCVLAISAFEFWMGLRFRSFIAPIAIGIMLWIFSNLVTFEYKLEYFEVNPFTYLTVASFNRYQENLVYVKLGAVIYCIAFLALGFLDFSKKRLR